MFRLVNSEEIYIPSEDENLLTKEFSILSTNWKQFSTISNKSLFLTASCNKNNDKNRYRDVLPYDNNLIQGDYINASPIYIQGHHSFIACQSPLKNTIDDFFNMIFKENCEEIICLAEIEKNKVDNYLKYSSDNFQCTSTILRNETINLKLIYSVIDMKISNKNTNYTKNIILYYYVDWKDKNVPNFENLITLYDDVKINRKNKTKTIVHCSAGIGRTGTYIAIELMLEVLEKGEYFKPTGDEKSPFYFIVNTLRSKRYGMVQNIHQYAFIHYFITQYFQK